MTNEQIAEYHVLIKTHEGEWWIKKVAILLAEVERLRKLDTLTVRNIRF